VQHPALGRLGSAAVTVLVVVTSIAGPPARANSFDLFGLGGRGAAMGDAVTALSTGPAAHYYNPAGTALGDRAELMISALGYQGWLKYRETTLGIDNPFEIAVGQTVAVPFKGKLAKRIWLGLVLSTHSDILARIKAHLPSDPFYPYFDNRTQRLVLLITLAGKLLDHPKHGRLSAGLSVNYFAAVGGTIIGQEGPSRSLEARVSENLAGFVRWNAGLRYDWRWLHAGLVFRQQFSERFGTESYNFVAGTDLNLAFSSEGLFSPHTLVAGLGFTPGQRLALGLDVAWSMWHLYGGPYVRVTSLLPLVGGLVGDLPRVNFKDTVAVRLGVEYRVDLPKKLVLPLRLGLAFETSPVPEQPGRTNLLDGHKFVTSLGLGLDFGRRLKRRITLDLHVRLHALIPRTFKKTIYTGSSECPAQPSPLTLDQALQDEVPCDRTDASTLGLQISNPGYPSLRASGVVLSGGLTLGVEL
jgi:hypothetical protein